MPHFICKTCGMQFGERGTEPPGCPICEDKRQYVRWEGQAWTTMAALHESHRNEMRTAEPHLTGIGTEPKFAIGQRALLVQTEQGNLLWDCISMLDEATKTAVSQLGGIRAIAISHPHYYSSMVEWAHAFDAPIYLHANDRQHVMRPDASIEFWQGETKSLFGGLTLINSGGHFDGGTVLHWPDGANGRGLLCTGDIIMVAQDRRFVTFMYSYPNYIPLSPANVERIVASVEPFTFERIYGAWWDLKIETGAKTAVARSAERYINAIRG